MINYTEPHTHANADKHKHIKWKDILINKSNVGRSTRKKGET